MKFWSSKKNNFLISLIVRFVVLYFLQLVQICQSQTTSLTMMSSTYSAQAGSTVSITCLGSYLQPSDIIWAYYSPSTPSDKTFIYRDNIYQGSFFSRFNVTTIQANYTNLITSLIILSAIYTDSNYIYECQCNQYGTCKNGVNATAIASLTVVTTTTSTTSTTSATTTASKSSLCFEGSFNTAQYVLVIITMIILGIASLLFHYSFHGSLVETFFLILVLVLSTFCLIVGIVFWINSSLLSDTSYASIIIVCCCILGCIFLWILLLQYAIRLCLSNELKTIIVVLICLDGLFEAASAALLIAANVYCSGHSSLSAISGFNYSYLEIIGATFMVLFALLLLVIAGVVNYLRKKRNTEELVNSFKKLTNSQASTPANFNGFVPRSSASSFARPPALIQEVWFPSTTKVTPLDSDSVSAHYDDMMPDKPKKLTPIYSRKRAEIKEVNSSENTDIESIDISSNQKTNESDATNSRKFKSKNKSQVEKMPPQKQKVDEVDEFENIWDTNNLMPQIEENIGNSLPTIGEEFTNTGLSRSKSTVGGKIAKLSQKEKTLFDINLNKDLQLMHTRSASDLSDVANFNNNATKNKSDESFFSSEDIPNRGMSSSQSSFDNGERSNIKNRKKLTNTE